MQGDSAGTDKAKELKNSVRWAIIKTNIIGMPLLVVLVFVILGITVSSLSEGDLEHDPIFFFYNLAVLLLVSGSFVIIHYFIVIRSIDPCLYLLELNGDGGAGLDRQVSLEALEASDYFPFITMKWSLYFYSLGTILAMLAIQIGYCFSFRQMWAFFIGVFATGVIISVFQFYTSRKALREFQAGLLTRHPDLILEERTEAQSVLEIVGIKGRFLGAMVIITAVSVIVTAVAAFNTAHNALQRQLGKEYIHKLEEESPRIARSIESIPTTEDLRSFMTFSLPNRNVDYLEEGLVGDKGTTPDLVIMTGPDGSSMLSEGLSDKLRALTRIILEGAPLMPEFRRPTVHVLREGVYSVVLGLGKAYTLVHVPIREDDDAEPTANLMVMIPAERYSEAMLGMYVFVYTVMIVILLPLALIFGKLASEEIRDPLVSLMDTLQAMSEGDLSKNVTVTGKDEIGVLSRSLARAIFGLRRIIGKIRDSVSALDESATAIAHMSGEVSTGSLEQVKQVNGTSESVEEMTDSVQSIADSIQTLASSTEESSASIIEVQATIEEVADSVDALSTAVAQTTTSIQEMNSSIKEVAENVGFLTRKSEEAMGALSEMEKMIGRVTDSSERTAKITENVAGDAEQGTRAVEMTIKGIDKIQQTSQGVAEVITSLGKRTGEIDNILNVISDVTDETNLLALNAAIIAAQAGEHGRGFAVVADEIKDLAERTSASTKEIAVLIESVQDEATSAVDRVKDDMDNISEGVKIAQEAGRALAKIEESVKGAMEQTRAIADAASIQADKSRQVIEFMDGVNSLVSQVHQATQEQSKSGDQIAHAADQMEEIAKQVRRATQEQAHGSRQITQAIENIVEITHYINNAQGDQKRGTENVSVAVRRIKEVADSNSDRVGVMSANVESLNKLANELRGLISEFNLEDSN